VPYLMRDNETPHNTDVSLVGTLGALPLPAREVTWLQIHMLPSRVAWACLEPTATMRRSQRVSADVFVLVLGEDDGDAGYSVVRSGQR
jgi:hypothetical protein